MARTWWKRPWVGPLALVAVAFVVFSLPPYLTLDPARSRVEPPDVPGYYPLLVAHVLCGSVAMLTCCFQVWPRFRARYPVAHRRIGRAYVFAGVLPAGVIGVFLGAVSPFGPVAATSNVLLAVLWLLCTATGHRRARARRYAEHRRWMVRSFALTMSIVSNRLWAAVLGTTLGPALTALYPDEPAAVAHAIAGITTWTGWVLPLLITEWWLDRPRAVTRRQPAREPARAG